MGAHDDMSAVDPLALAVCERFLDEWRTGRRPRLSVYVRRYPAYVTALTDLVASLPPDSRGASTLEQSAETLLDAFPERTWMDEGVSRALRSIFDQLDAPHTDARPRRVAEERGVYQARGSADPSTDDQRERD